MSCEHEFTVEMVSSFYEPGDEVFMIWKRCRKCGDGEAIGASELSELPMGTKVALFEHMMNVIAYAKKSGG